MFAALKQFFVAITVLFSAFEKQASAINHLSTWADEAAGAFADQARIDRAKQLNVLNHQLEQTSKFPAIEQA